MIKTSIVIPAYKEEEGLPIVLEKLLQFTNENLEVIVVDDGSDDRTSELASSFPCRIIKHEVNKGKGEALKTGIMNARGENVIRIDADDTYPVEVIPRMAKILETCDMVVGSRKYSRENIPWFNRIGNFIFRIMIRGIYGFKPFDPCTGLYGVKKHHLEAMKLSSTRFAIEPEISIKGSRLRLKQQEIPISYRNRHGNGKLNSIKVGFEDLYTILKLIFWRPKEGNGQDSTQEDTNSIRGV